MSRAQGPQSFSISSEQVDVEAMKQNVIKVNPQDLRVWELVTDVPQVSIVWAYILLALNILFPGVGTLILSCVGDSNINKTQLGVGFAQLLTAPYLIGWVCSIYWGVLIVKKAKGDHNDIKKLINGATGANASAGAAAGGPTAAL